MVELVNITYSTNRRACAAEPRSYHIAGGIPVEKELAIHS